MNTPTRQIILDTETTGLYPLNGDRLIEFAGVEMIKRQLTHNNLHLYVHPERDIPAEAAAVHGITLEQLENNNAPVFAKVGQEIADFIHGAELIIHNASFDVGFLNMEFQRMGLPTIEELGCTITDTLTMARAMFPGQKNSLDALCTRFEIDRSKRVLHGALIDCELLADVYLAMTRSQFSLYDAFETPSESLAVAAMQRPTQLKILAANADELAAHEAYLNDLDKATGGACAWRQHQPNSEQTA
ncbi:MAG: DNA polymerase III subunit epsilon [Neisseria sp.]|nr:DNA polymerase III subunit epsilon [Neisseria sp.]